MTRILITTTSYHDIPGKHHDLLEQAGFEIEWARGPLPEERMLEIVGDFEGIICGDDAITRAVLEKALPKLRVLSKYGIGVDKIDVEAATDLGLPVLYTPGVNHTTVAEHTYGLLLALTKHIVEEANHTAAGRWERLTGNEIMGKTMGIIGLGRIGKEVAIRGKAFGLDMLGYDIYWDEDFANEYGVKRVEVLADILKASDIVTLHTNLCPETRHLINAERLALMKDGVIILNCARGELVETAALAEALETGKVGAYGTDVLDQEPPPPDHPLLGAKNCLITPHIASRTNESVQRQACMATNNLILALNGEKPLAQVNNVPINK